MPGSSLNFILPSLCSFLLSSLDFFCGRSGVRCSLHRVFENPAAVGGPRPARRGGLARRGRALREAPRALLCQFLQAAREAFGNPRPGRSVERGPRIPRVHFRGRRWRRALGVDWPMRVRKCTFLVEVTLLIDFASFAHVATATHRCESIVFLRLNLLSISR